MGNYIWLIIISFFLFSCDDLSSRYPAGKVCHSYIDTNLIGYWEAVNVQNFATSNLPLDTHMIAIMPFNKKEYLLQALKLDDSGRIQVKDMGTYRGFISNIGKQKIANIQVLSTSVNETEEYLIYPFELNNDTLTFYSFYSTKVNREFKSSCDLRKFLKKNFNNREMYSSVRKYKRKEFKIY